MKSFDDLYDAVQAHRRSCKTCHALGPNLSNLCELGFKLVQAYGGRFAKLIAPEPKKPGDA